MAVNLQGLLDQNWNPFSEEAPRYQAAIRHSSGLVHVSIARADWKLSEEELKRERDQCLPADQPRRAVREPNGTRPIEPAVA